MDPDASFWQAMTRLLTTHSIVLDRPKGTSHPRFAEMIYPLDYGYLENTTAGDGDGIDVWIGSLNTAINDQHVKTLTGILCTFDTLERDAEIKLLIGCSADDVQIIRDFHKDMHILYIPNPVAEHDFSS